jgi:hypothetical protein
MRKLVLLICLIPVATFSQSSQTPVQPTAMAAASPNDVAPLNLIIAQVKAAMDEYQKSRGGGPDALPPLSSAEFEFKTTTATTVGGTVNLFIFKFGASHENDVTNDVTYSYSLPKPPIGASSPKKPPVPLKDALTQAMQSAAAAVKTSGNLGKLNFSKLTVNLQYGVKWDVSGGGSFQFSFVTVGLSGDKNKNTVQSVKLVFGQ